MEKITKAGDHCIALIKSYEGFRSKPYLDSVGVPTIGYGTTFYSNGNKVTLKDAPISEATATIYLKEFLSHYEKFVDSILRDDVNQNQFDAILDFAYNEGIGSLKSSTLLKKINLNPNDPSIRKEFMKWVKAGGVVLPGLVKRRTEEANLYFNSVL
jgi:lysozyme